MKGGYFSSRNLPRPAVKGCTVQAFRAWSISGFAISAKLFAPWPSALIQESWSSHWQDSERARRRTTPQDHLRRGFQQSMEGSSGMPNRSAASPRHLHHLRNTEEAGGNLVPHHRKRLGRPAECLEMGSADGRRSKGALIVQSEACARACGPLDDNGMSALSVCLGARQVQPFDFAIHYSGTAHRSRRAGDTASGRNCRGSRRYSSRASGESVVIEHDS